MSNANLAFLESLKTGDVQAGSEFSVRNEDAQNKTRLKTIKSSKKESKKIAKYLIQMENAYPFNAQTGKADEQFNEANKLRPIMSAERSALSMKAYANENPELKASMIARAGKKEWDTSNLEELTDEDKQIFRSYRVVRIFTIWAMRVRDKRITGNDFGRDYTVDIVRDDLGNILGTRDKDGKLDGKIPNWMKAYELVSQVRFTELDDLRKARDAAKEDKPYELKSQRTNVLRADLKNITDEDFSKLRSEIMQDNPLTDDNPMNFVLGYEIDLDGSGFIKDKSEFETITPDEMDKKLRLIRVNQGVEALLNKYREGTYKSDDVFYDFLEMDMICPADEDVKDPVKERGRAAGTEYRNGLKALAYGEQVSKFPYMEQLKQAEQVHQDSISKTLDKRFMVSSYTTPLTKEVEDQILDVISESDLLASPYLTQDIVRRNEEILSKIFGADAQKLIASVKVGYSKLDNTELDADAAQAESKAVNLEDLKDEDGGAGTDEVFETDGDGGNAVPVVDESQAVVGTETEALAPTKEPDEIVDIDTEDL